MLSLEYYLDLLCQAGCPKELKAAHYYMLMVFGCDTMAQIEKKLLVLHMLLASIRRVCEKYCIEDDVQGQVVSAMTNPFVYNEFGACVCLGVEI
jgi:hypothetical protein